MNPDPDAVAQMMKDNGVLACSLHRILDDPNALMIHYQFADENTLKSFVAWYDPMVVEWPKIQTGGEQEILEWWVGTFSNKYEENKMNTYQTLQQKALGLAFILGPLLLTIGTAAYLLGIGLTPFGTDSWVDGIFSAFGFVIMIPILFELARILGQRAPWFGIICAIAGLGWGLSIIPAAARLIQMDIINAGLNESIWNVMGSTPGFLPLLLGSLIGILAVLLLGIGLLWKGGIPRWAAGLLIVGSIFFAIGIGGGADIAWWQASVAYPLACVLWLAALAPIGLRYLGSGSQVYELETATT